MDDEDKEKLSTVYNIVVGAFGAVAVSLIVAVIADCAGWIR